jgi:hypothetical protein
MSRRLLRRDGPKGLVPALPVNMPVLPPVLSVVSRNGVRRHSLVVGGVEVPRVYRRPIGGDRFDRRACCNVEL